MASCECAMVTLRLVVGNYTVSCKVIIEQNSENAQFWESDQSTFHGCLSGSLRLAVAS